MLFKGTDVNNIPKLPPLSTTEAPDPASDTFEMPVEEVKSTVTNKVQRKTSGPKTNNPYQSIGDDQLMLSIFVGIVLFIPLLFCLCRL